MNHSNNYYKIAFQDVFKYIKQNKSFWPLFVLRSGYVVANIFPTILIGQVVNTLEKDIDNIEKLVLLVVIYMGIIVIGPMIEVWTAYWNWHTGSKVMRQISNETTQKLRHAGVNFWQKYSKGQTHQIMESYGESVGTLVARIPHNYLRHIGAILGIILASSFISPFILVIYLINITIYIWNLLYQTKKEKLFELEEQKEYEHLSKTKFQYLTNYNTIFYLNLFSREEEIVQRGNEKAFQAYLKREVVSMWKWFINNFLHNVTILCIFVYCIWLVRQGEINTGTMLTAVLFSTQFSAVLDILVQEVSNITGHVTKIQRYHETFDSIQEKTITKDPITSFEKISIQNVSIESKAKEKLLDTVNLDIVPRESIAIAGPSGSGKSTLLDCLLLVAKPTSGSILLDNSDYQELDPEQVSSLISVVPQNVQLFNTTIEDNIILDKPKDTAKLQKVLEICNLTDFVAGLPAELQTIIEEDSVNISGGERQRIGIARALYQDQQILILDEASAALDPANEKHVITEILKHYKDKTIIYVTHKYALLNKFDNILVFNEAKIIEQGSFHKLIKKKGLFNSLYEDSLVANLQN